MRLVKYKYGINKTEDSCIIGKITLSLDAPQDNDIAKVLYCRETLEEDDISLGTVLLEL